MIHQIRKMIGHVIAIVRGFTPETTLIESFGEKKVYMYMCHVHSRIFLIIFGPD